jgi:hypothetical protein
MNTRFNLFALKLKTATLANFRVLKNWKYSLFAVLFALVFIQFLYWALNIELFWYFLTAGGLSFIEKADVFSSIISSYLSSLPVWQAFVVVGLALVQGIVIAVLIYIVRTQHKLNKAAFGTTTVASIVAIFSVGCVSCGTSIIAPILAIFVSGSTASLAESINKIAILVGFIIALFAFYAVGKTAANIQAKHKKIT